MKRFYIYSIALAILGCFIISCYDKLPEIIPDPSENDKYQGVAKNIKLGIETGDFSVRDIRCYFMTEKGEKIFRTAEHLRKKDSSHIQLKIGLKEGVYRLLYLEYDLAEPLYEGRVKTGRCALGGRVRVSGQKIASMDSFDSFMQMYGKGTEESPYIVSSPEHLQRINDVVNGALTNSRITSETYFSQADNIDVWELCWNFEDGYGWYPIGYTNILPFRGHYNGNGYKISGLYSYRDKSSGVGLFGFLHRAIIDSVVVENADLYGLYATGGIAGAIINSGGNRNVSAISNCKVVGSRIAGSREYGNDADTWSMSIGGILGAVDQYSSVVISNCFIDSSTLVTGANAVGGILGSGNLYSSTSISNCTNKAEIKGAFSAIGGIVGCADTLSVTGCTNTANITGAIKYPALDNVNGGMSTGGIVGGAGNVIITACTNTGNITGHDGVGGIIGSTRFGNGTEVLYNTAYLRYCGNTGSVKGNSYVGGICGESQFGGYGLYNTGSISGGNYTGGILGNGSAVAVFNSVNSGVVNGADYVSGITGSAVWGSFVLNQNYGAVTATGNHVAGVVSLVGDNTFVHYCENGAEIVSKGDAPMIGGIVGEIGDPSEWTSSQTIGIIVGMLEMITPCFSIPAVAVVEQMGSKVGLFISTVAAGFLWTPIDVTLNGMGYSNIFSDYEVSAINRCADSVVMEVNDDVTKILQDVRSSNSGWQSYTNNIDLMRSACESSTENNIDMLCRNLNAMRFERAEEVAADRQKKEIVHTAVASACIVIGAVATIVSAIPSGGSSVLAAITTGASVIGTATAIAGGANSVVQSATAYGDNTVLVTQCVNRGTIRTTNQIDTYNSYVGGIVGRMHDASLIRDCLNTGAHKGNNARHGQMAGGIGGGCEVYNSFAIGTTNSWNGFVGGYDQALNMDMDGLYYYKNTSNISTAYDMGHVLSSEECGVISSYNGWSIGSDASKWIIQTETSPNYPVPNKSEAM